MRSGSAPTTPSSSPATGSRSRGSGSCTRRSSRRPGVYDDAYIDRILRTQRQLAAAGVVQPARLPPGLLQRALRRAGVPRLGGPGRRPPSVGYPLAQFVGLGHNRAWDHFWANDPGPGGVRLQDRYAAALAPRGGPFPRRAPRARLRPDQRALAGNRMADVRQQPRLPPARPARGLLQAGHSGLRQADPDAPGLVRAEPCFAGSGGAIDLPDARRRAGRPVVPHLLPFRRARRRGRLRPGLPDPRAARVRPGAGPLGGDRSGAAADRVRLDEGHGRAAAHRRRRRPRRGRLDGMDLQLQRGD